ncbi:MAG: protoheme IX farnesyltransferase, partial [Proteobacteria bacterium]|nr:protoheme IX farnesyltransferase [Pseudomonadota bacterium]
MTDPCASTKIGNTLAESPQETGAIGHYLALTKPKIYLAIAVTALMGLALQRNFTDYSIWMIATLVIATILASAGGAVLNHYYERETDGLMERTMDRPLVKGTIHPPSYALYFGWTLSISGILLCYLNLGSWSTFWLFMGFFTYVFVYTLWLKHNSHLNVTIGGLCSSFAVLAGDTAVSGAISTNGLILAILLFFWNPAHFWNLAVLYQKDYARAKIPMLPHLVGDKMTQALILLHLVLMVGCSILLGIFGTPGWVYLSVSIIFGFLVILANIQNYFAVSNKLF